MPRVRADVEVLDLDEALQQTASATRGSFTRTVLGTVGDDERAMMVAEVDYDLGTGYTDFTVRVLLGEDGEPVDPAEVDRTELRFINTPERSLMRHPLAEEMCGAPWVEMPREVIADVAGVDPSVLFAPGTWPEPFEIIDTRTSDEVIVNDAWATVYGIEVPGSSGMSIAALLRHPDLAARLDAMTSKAAVHIARSTGTIEKLEVVASDEVTALIGGAGRPRLSFRWDIERSPDVVDQTLPTDVADPSCGEGALY